MSKGEWHLDLDAERDVLIPWLDAEPDAETREAVVAWLGEMVKDPLRFQPDQHDVYWHRVKRTSVAVIWVLDRDGKAVVLVHIGD